MIIVTGIARSGLSLTMQMLHAGGIPCAGEPPAFEPYPLGQIEEKTDEDLHRNRQMEARHIQ